MAEVKVEVNVKVKVKAKAKANVKVNVNVSPEQRLEPGFHQEVVEALAASGLRPERLEVEVTESIFLRDASVARNALEQVMALGCSVEPNIRAMLGP